MLLSRRMAGSPAFDFGDLRVGAINNDTPLAKKNLSGFTVEGDPIAFIDCFARNRRFLGARIDGEARATDDASLS